MKKETTAREIVNMLPKGLLKELSEKYKIDYKIKKLSGEVIFLTLIQALFSSTNLSLRNLAIQLKDKKFQKYILKNRDYITIRSYSFPLQAQQNVFRIFSGNF